jgi:hypothetical protein
VRYFFTGRQIPVDAILLVESGSRGLLEKIVPSLRQTWGSDVPIDLVTCYSSLPRGLHPETTRVYRVSDYRGRQGRRKLYRELARNRYSMQGIICSEEPVMTKWKWVLAFRIPAKVFIVNENGDYFWFDRQHLGIIRRFVLLRTGLAGVGAVRTLTRLLSFPFTLLYLLLYATTVHARRAMRRGRGTRRVPPRPYNVAM